MRRVTLAAAMLFLSSSVSAESLSQSAQSELVLMIQQLQAEVRQLRGEIETQQYRMQKLEREQLERYRDVDRRLSALITGGSSDLSASSPAPETQPDTVDAGTEVAAQAPTPAVAPAAALAPAISDSDAYASAFALVRERRFEDALSAFESFVATYPSSERLANAHYWIGEVQLAQQKLDPARAAFKLVVDQFTDHPKRPDALYKLGVTLDRLGDVAGRTATFEQLISAYPKSSAAGLARNYQSRS